MVTTIAPDPVSPAPRVEVITSVQRRRRWSTAEKIRLVEEAMQPGLSVSFVARQHGVAPSLLFAWKRRMQEGGFQAVAADEDVVGTSRVRELERRVRQVECLLGAQDAGKRDPQRGPRAGTAKKLPSRSSSWDEDASR